MTFIGSHALIIEAISIPTSTFTHNIDYILVIPSQANLITHTYLNNGEEFEVRTEGLQIKMYI